MAVSECSAFSEDCKYFSYCGPDGKLKIWDTSSGILKQEYTPNLHLSSPCTCLTWISTSRSLPSETPRIKRKRKSLRDGTVDVVAMGMRLGNIVLYSVATGTIVGKLEGVHHGKVNDLTWNANSNLFSCGDDKLIVEWSISDNTCKSKWKADKSQVTCILVLPDGESLLSANRTIQWWDLSTKELKKSFTGHVTEIYKLTLINKSSENYVLSSAKGDRFLNVWSLNPNGKGNLSAASFVAEDVVTVVSVLSGSDRHGSPTNMAAVTRSGSLHFYRHILNGRSTRPLKPALTLHISSDTGQVAEGAVPLIPILGAHVCDEDTVLIAHGSYIFLTFERISSKTKEKHICLVRQDPHKTIRKEVAMSKMVIPETGLDVEYVTPSVAPSTAFKRNRMGKQDLPMEERLEGLTLNNKPESSSKPGPPSADSLAQLLVQGLHSKEKKFLQSVLLKKDTKLINNTVLRLPLQVIVPLVEELTTLMQGKTYMSQMAADWLKALLSIHAGHLLASPDTSEMFTSLLGLVESRLSVLAPLMRIRGRLDMLISQIEEGSSRGEASCQLVEPALVYQDPDSSDEASDSVDHWDELSEEDAEGEVGSEGASDHAAMASDSEDHWVELSEEDAEEEVKSEGKKGEDDVDMSS